MEEGIKSKAQSAESMAHGEAIDILSREVCMWFKQIHELEHDNLPDGHGRANALRKKAHEVQKTIKELEASSQKSVSSSQNLEGARA